MFKYKGVKERGSKKLTINAKKNKVKTCSSSRQTSLTSFFLKDEEIVKQLSQSPLSPIKTCLTGQSDVLPLAINIDEKCVPPLTTPTATKDHTLPIVSISPNHIQRFKSSCTNSVHKKTPSSKKSRKKSLKLLKQKRSSSYRKATPSIDQSPNTSTLKQSRLDECVNFTPTKLAYVLEKSGQDPMSMGLSPDLFTPQSISKKSSQTCHSLGSNALVLLEKTKRNLFAEDNKSFGEDKDEELREKRQEKTKVVNECNSNPLMEYIDQQEIEDDKMETSTLECENETHSETKTKELTSQDLSEDEDYSLMDDDLLHMNLSDDWDTTWSHDDHMTNDVNGLPHRYKVEEVYEQLYQDENITRWTNNQVVLKLSHLLTKAEAVCYLRDDWNQTDVRRGDIVHFMDKCSSLLNKQGPHSDYFHQSNHFVISNDNNRCIIINPDHLISGTAISSGITCTRRAVLSELFKDSFDQNEAMLVGKLLHSLFQKTITVSSCQPDQISVEYVLSLIPPLLSDLNTLDQIYSLGVTESSVEDQLKDCVPLIIKWCNDYQQSRDIGDTLHNKMEWKRQPSTSELVNVSVTNVVDIEENIWCPRYGLKGKIDATVEIKVSNENDINKLLVPLELKTGRMFTKLGTIEHRAQVILYCLMLCDSHMTSVPAGLLYYMKGDHTLSVPAVDNEIRALVIARNHLARYHGNHWDHMTLPEILREPRTCQYCPHISHCALHHKVFEGGTANSSGLRQYYPSSLDNMKPSWIEFYRHWYRLTVEEMSYEQNKDICGKIWRRNVPERVNDGTCISDLLPCQPEVLVGKETDFKIRQIFKRQQKSISFSCLIMYDRVVVNRQDGHGWAVAMGYIDCLTEQSVTLVLDKAIPCGNSTVLYCIDVNNSVRGNVGLSTLAAVCSSDGEREHQLRELVIDLRLPRFSTLSELTITSREEKMLTSLNKEQRAAVEKALLAQDYSLVLGMPGTGKTTTIACLVQLLVARGNSILLTSLTNSAVDNILIKLLEFGIDFLRVGSKGRIHPSTISHSVHVLTKTCTNVEEIKNLYEKKMIVATTCHSLHHSVFSHRLFDYCIIDEAGQIPLPLSLAPLRMSSVFVLVGDHYQLPPLVQSPVARDGGYGESLFKQLSECHNSALVSLTQQHRMNRDIMELSNILVYDNRLQCASEDVAIATMCIPKWDNSLKPDWLERAVSPQNSVIFLNTDKCGLELEERTGDVICNHFEAVRILDIIKLLLKVGVCPCNVLVITQYRHQQKLLQKLLHEQQTTGSYSPESHSHIKETDSYTTSSPSSLDCHPIDGIDSYSSLWNEHQSVEVLTVDKCQGRDKSCVIVSFVRSNIDGKVGNLLLNWQRINVALTRAKHKLIFIGSCHTLSNAPYIKKLIELLNSKQWIIDVNI